MAKTHLSTEMVNHTVSMALQSENNLNFLFEFDK